LASLTLRVTIAHCTPRSSLPRIIRAKRTLAIPGDAPVGPFCRKGLQRRTGVFGGQSPARQAGPTKETSTNRGIVRRTLVSFRPSLACSTCPPEPGRQGSPGRGSGTRAGGCRGTPTGGVTPGRASYRRGARGASPPSDKTPRCFQHTARGRERDVRSPAFRRNKLHARSRPPPKGGTTNEVPAA
jgi:hypothetical protein